MSSDNVSVDSVFGKSPDLSSKKELCSFLEQHRTVVSGHVLPRTGTKAILLECLYHIKLSCGDDDICQAQEGH